MLSAYRENHGGLLVTFTCKCKKYLIHWHKPQTSNIFKFEIYWNESLAFTQLSVLNGCSSEVVESRLPMCDAPFSMGTVRSLDKKWITRIKAYNSQCSQSQVKWGEGFEKARVRKEIKIIKYYINNCVKIIFKRNWLYGAVHLLTLSTHTSASVLEKLL